jgi:hypothetical protein
MRNELVIKNSYVKCLCLMYPIRMIILVTLGDYTKSRKEIISNQYEFT